MNYDGIFKAIINKKEKDQIFTGIIYGKSPLQVLLHQDDNPINVYTTVDIDLLYTNQNVLMLKYINKFVIIGVLGNSLPYTKLYKPSANQTIGVATLTNITSMVFTLKANTGTYIIDTTLNVRNPTKADIIRLAWSATGVYTKLSGRNCRGGEAVSNSTTTLTLCRNSGGHGEATEVYYTLPNSTTSSYLTEHSIIQTDSESDATFQLQARQSVADASNPITISAFSNIVVRRVAF